MPRFESRVCRLCSHVTYFTCLYIYIYLYTYVSIVRYVSRLQLSYLVVKMITHHMSSYVHIIEIYIYIYIYTPMVFGLSSWGSTWGCMADACIRTCDCACVYVYIYICLCYMYVYIYMSGGYMMVRISTNVTLGEIF